MQKKNCAASSLKKIHLPSVGMCINGECVFYIYIGTYMCVSICVVYMYRHTHVCYTCSLYLQTHTCNMLYIQFYMYSLIEANTHIDTCSDCQHLSIRYGCMHTNGEIIIHVFVWSWFEKKSIKFNMVIKKIITGIYIKSYNSARYTSITQH